MTVYKILRVYKALEGEIGIEGSHLNEVREVVDEIKKVHPNCRIKTAYSNCDNVIYVDELSGDDFRMLYKLLAWLGDNGWEPFAPSGHHGYNFRLAYEPKVP